MAYDSLKTVINNMLTSLRAYTTDPLKSASFRKGPQLAFKAGSGTVFVTLEAFDAGTEVLGPNGIIDYDQNILLTGYIPDTQDETAEDKRLDLYENLLDWLTDNRCLGNARNVQMLSGRFFIMQITESTSQIYRCFEIVIGYKIRRN